MSNTHVSTIAKIISFKTLVILGVLKLAVCALEDYYFFVVQDESIFYMLSIIELILRILIYIFMIGLFLIVVINREYRWFEKIGFVLLIILIISLVDIVSYGISQSISDVAPVEEYIFDEI